ncbi:energy transducer TonB [Sphingosinicella rhizophila]|uniref:Energy transducer TonB n=1 Tax=Sphingosinicella rhizophila TaxID=3050082 RepID=A0ABU3Q9N9_9SPHN|nr:energy transducer TonB [Sphingosinicella sp. GR2756]MDT9600097.1 energy transducer TonB [Sphingosinicella sp. GR2756]
MTILRTRADDRIKAAAGAVLLQGLLAYFLLSGMKVPVPERVSEPLSLISILLAPPSEPIVPPPVRNRRPEGEASPPNIRSRATQIVAPPPVVTLPLPPPLVAAPVAGPGYEPTQGAADVRGPGTGAGGEGDGRGGGGLGDGDGGGGRGIPPRLMKGRIRNADYPESAKRVLAGGTVTVLYTVATNGRVVDCQIQRSSGHADLDATTCRLIVERFRYRPSLDDRGRPIRSKIIADHHWIVDESEAAPPHARL